MIKEQLDFFDKIDKPAAFTKEMEENWRRWTHGNLFNVGLLQIQLKELLEKDEGVRRFVGAAKADEYIKWAEDRLRQQREQDSREPSEMYRR